MTQRPSQQARGEAIGSAYVAHYPDLFRFLRHRLGSATEAADLAHESFASALDDGRESSRIPPTPSPERAAETRQRLRLLAQAVEALPPRCQEAFKLHKFHGLPHDEVAARMGISRNMVEKHLIRAMVHIRERIERRESA